LRLPRQRHRGMSCSQCCSPLLAQQFGNNEDYDCATNASSEKKIDQRIAGGGKHWNERCDHHMVNPPCTLLLSLQSG
jgi:hypothetical protein